MSVVMAECCSSFRLVPLPSTGLLAPMEMPEADPTPLLVVTSHSLAVCHCGMFETDGERVASALFSHDRLEFRRTRA